jgi:serine protease
VYAANYGVDVINCSWGSTYPSQLGREAVRYAVWDKQTLVVAAAGNSNNSVRLYPAAFEEVLSVTGTGGANEKWPSASFYEEVRLSAPGGNIEVASENSGYTSINGTSFASPIVSGIAGLLKSYYPSETSLQAGARMESSSYFIDTIPSNSSFVGKLGFGRVDAYSAINQVAGPWLKYIERQYDSQRGDGIVLAGDSLYLKGFLLNFLAAAPAGLTVLIQSDSPYLQWVDSTYTPFQVSGNNSVHVQTSSFKGYVLINCPENHLVSFTVKFFYNGILAGTSRFSYFLNPDFYNWTQNEIQMGVSNSGRLGFSDANSRRGIGLRRSNGANYLLEQFYSPFSFMIGRSGNVSNATIASSIPTCCPLPVDQHFQSLEPIRIDRKEGFGIQRIRSRFNDSNFGNNAIGVEVTRYVYGDTAGILKNVLFMDHFIHNAGNQAISDFKFGYYCDMDVPDNHLLDTPNLAYWDSVYRMGVHVHVSGGNGAGFVMAHNNPVHYYAFDVAGGNGSIRINDGFTQSEKWQSMSSGILRGSSSPTYAAQYLGSECDTLASQSCYFFPFAIVIGDSLSELRQAAQAALNHYSVYNIWTGKAGTDNWHDSGNWSKLQVPTSSDKVFIVRPSIPGGFMPVIKDADGYAGYVETLCGGDLYIINGRNLWVGP